MNPFLIHKVIMNYLYDLLQKPTNVNNNNNNTSLVKLPYFKLNIIHTMCYYLLAIALYSTRYSIFRQIFNSLHHLTIWLMETCPFLAYYSFGNTPNTIVKLKI